MKTYRVCCQFIFYPTRVNRIYGNRNFKQTTHVQTIHVDVFIFLFCRRYAYMYTFCSRDESASECTVVSIHTAVIYYINCITTVLRLMPRFDAVSVVHVCVYTHKCIEWIMRDDKEVFCVNEFGLLVKCLDICFATTVTVVSLFDL